MTLSLSRKLSKPACRSLRVCWRWLVDLTRLPLAVPRASCLAVLLAVLVLLALPCSYFAGLDAPETKALYLGWNHIGPAGAEELGVLCSRVKHLQLLDLSWTRFGVDSLPQLASGLQQCASLTDLNLSGNM